MKPLLLLELSSVSSDGYAFRCTRTLVRSAPIHGRGAMSGEVIQLMLVTLRTYVCVPLWATGLGLAVRPTLRSGPTRLLPLHTDVPGLHGAGAALAAGAT